MTRWSKRSTNPFPKKANIKLTGIVQNKHFSIQETNFPPAEALILKGYGGSHKNDRPVEFLPMVPKPLTPQTLQGRGFNQNRAGYGNQQLRYLCRETLLNLECYLLKWQSQKQEDRKAQWLG